ncbi:MAG: hypothetical protein L6Q47_06160 [Ignavibacteriaceae bacterium]|nr:hypothetical protein [Ignavibacteriaceae bacterium]
MKSLFLFCALLLFTGSGFPQDSVFTPKYAISFGIGENFTLTKFNGEIAVKRIFANSDQLRLFISPNAEINDAEYSTQPSNRFHGGTDYSISVGADYIWVVKSHTSVHLYSGAGLAYLYHKTTLTEDAAPDYISHRHSESKRILHQGRVRGILGTEWKVSDEFGIHCEYIVNFSYGSDKYNEKITQTTTPDQIAESIKNSAMLTSAVLLGLSLYF